jgi:hypothetical protein
MSEALRLAEEDERTSGILRMQPKYAPELRRLHANAEKVKQLALIHSQQCMAHHGRGPEVQAAWIELCKAIDLGQT